MVRWRGRFSLSFIFSYCLALSFSLILYRVYIHTHNKTIKLSVWTGNILAFYSSAEYICKSLCSVFIHLCCILHLVWMFRNHEWTAKMLIRCKCRRQQEEQMIIRGWRGECYSIQFCCFLYFLRKLTGFEFTWMNLTTLNVLVVLSSSVSTDPYCL